VHQVNRAGLERLLVLMEGCHWLNRGRQELPSGLQTPNKETRAGSDADSAVNLTSDSVPSERDMAEASGGDDAVVSSPPPLGAISERHVYKYRCGQCSLAFRSQAKLELHAQYHQIRNTTRCRLCQRNFRSVQALLKHVETSHTELAEETERYRHSLMTHPLLMAGQFDQLVKGMNDNDMEELEVDRAEEEEPADEIKEDERDKGADLPTNHQLGDKEAGQVLLGMSKPLPYSLDKYLDPKRPFKCDICKESFTQKNILLVHFNSVSHLHKVKKIMTRGSGSGSNSLLLTPQSDKGSSSPGSNSSPNNSNTAPGSTLLSVLGSLSARKQLLESDTEDKPFKCNICQVAYSQASTLDIHIRSVVHRTRASHLQDLVLTGQVDLSKPLIEQPNQESLEQLNHFLSPKSLSSSQCEQKTPPNHQTTEKNKIEGEECEDPQPISSSTPKSLMEEFDKKEKKDNSFNTFIHQNTLSPPSTRQNDNSSSLSASQSEASIDVQSRSADNQGPTSQILSFLHNYGFELVMQFNEKHQKTCEGEHENIKNEEEQFLQISGNPKSSKAEERQLVSSFGTCPFCSEQLPGFWPLKVHIEEKHGKTVPLEVVQTYLEDLKASVTAEQNIKDGELKDKNCPNKEPDMAESEEQIPAVEKSFPLDCSKITKNNDETRKQFLGNSAVPSMPPNMNLHPPLVPSSLFSPVALFHSQTPNKQQYHTTTIENQIFAKLGIDPEIVRQAGLDPKLLIHLASVDPKAALDPRLLAMFSTAPNPHPLAAGNQKMMQLALESKLSGLPGFAPSSDMKQQYLENCQRRARTRISDDQLRILRANFDINNSPSEEQVAKLTMETGLPPKVIKHWFRNTLFKERQKNKDSPYNFNNPPSTMLNLEEYEKTGKSKVIQLNEDQQKQQTEAGHKSNLHQQAENTKDKTVSDEGNAPVSQEKGEEDKDSIAEIKQDPDVGQEEELPGLEELRKLQMSMALRVSVSPDNMSFNSHSYEGLFSPQVSL
jgi:AT-binding transcription factor 1